MSEITQDQRVEYVLRKLDRWTENTKANAQRSTENGEHSTAARLGAQMEIYREIAGLLRGNEDEYIARVLRTRA